MCGSCCRWVPQCLCLNLPAEGVDLRKRLHLTSCCYLPGWSVEGRLAPFPHLGPGLLSVSGIQQFSDWLDHSF